MKTSAAFAFILASLPLAVHAEPERGEHAQIEYSFDDELVSGEVLRPDTEVLPSRRRGARPTLIEVRTSFVAELLASGEDL